MRRKRTESPIVQLGGDREVVGNGIAISATVTAYPIAARPIEVIDRGNAIWSASDSDRLSIVWSWLSRLQASRTIIWLDPPAPAIGEEVATVLKDAGVPVRFKPRQAVDAILSEVAVATPAQVSASMRDVVIALSAEATTGWPLVDIDYLNGTLDTALSGAGL